jgi:hypothetical protein
LGSLKEAARTVITSAAPPTLRLAGLTVVQAWAVEAASNPVMAAENRLVLVFVISFSLIKKLGGFAKPAQ